MTMTMMMKTPTFKIWTLMLMMMQRQMLKKMRLLHSRNPNTYAHQIGKQDMQLSGNDDNDQHNEINNGYDDDDYNEDDADIENVDNDE